MGLSPNPAKTISTALRYCVTIPIIALLSACDLASLVSIERQKTTTGPTDLVKIETSIDGNGVAVENLTMRVGDSRTLYANDRTAAGGLNGPATVTSWSLTPGLGTLTINSDGYSAAFVATTAGTGTVTVVVDGTSFVYTVNITTPLDPIISSTNIRPFATYSTSFLSVDVDWGRKYAYIGTTEGSVCLHVADFSAPASVSIVKSIGTADAIVTCRGVKIFDSNTKIVLSSYGNNKIDVWDITSSAPAAWARIATVGLGELGKNPGPIISLGAGLWDLWVPSRFRGRRIRFDANTPSSLTLAASACTATNCPGSSSLNALALLGDNLLLQPNSGSSEPLTWWRASTLPASVGYSGALGTVPMTSWGWTAVSNSARTKSFLGGAIGGAASYTFLGLSGGLPSISKKFTNTAASVIRWADFTIEGSKEYLYSLSANGRLDKWDVTDIVNPRLVASHTFTTGTPEFYGIDVNEYTGQAIIVTSRGDFILFDTSKMNVSEVPYATVP